MLRPPLESEFVYLISLVAATLREVNGVRTSLAYIQSTLESAAYIQSTLESADYHVCVAERAGKIAGVACFAHDSEQALMRYMVTGGGLEPELSVCEQFFTYYEHYMMRQAVRHLYVRELMSSSQVALPTLCQQYKYRTVGVVKHFFGAYHARLHYKLLDVPASSRVMVMPFAESQHKQAVTEFLAGQAGGAGAEGFLETALQDDNLAGCSVVLVAENSASGSPVGVTGLEIRTGLMPLVPMVASPDLTVVEALAKTLTFLFHNDTLHHLYLRSAKLTVPQMGALRRLGWLGYMSVDEDQHWHLPSIVEGVPPV